MNASNFGIANGRLAADPVIFENSDGSHKVKFTVIADNNYKTNGEYGSSAVPVQAFIAAGRGPGAYGFLGKGDRVNVAYSARQESFEKDGATQYQLVLNVEDLDVIDTKAEREARRANQAAQAGTQAEQDAWASVKA